MKIDMHCHVNEGSLDSKVGIQEYITLLKNNGFGGMVITDHNTYSGYRYWEDNMKDTVHKDFVVLRGIEYDTLQAGHVLVIMPENVRLPILEMRGLPLPLLIEVVHKYGGILGPAHPCGQKYLSITNTKYYKRHPEVMGRFDFIEAFNACESQEVNSAASALASKYGLAEVGGSDAHKERCVGKAFTEVSDTTLCESDLINEIRERSVKSCGGERYYGTTKDRIGRVNEVLLYSFWLYNKVGALIKKNRRNRWLKVFGVVG